MIQNKWQQVKSIAFQAMELPVIERRIFVNKSCGTNRWLKDQVESLLSAPDVETPFEEKPLVHYFYEINYLKG